MQVADAPAQRRFVVLEPDAEGHPREWLRHLIRFTASADVDYSVWFVVAPEVHRDLAPELVAAPEGRIRVLPLTPRERKFCTHRRLVISGFARWWTMRRYLRLARAEAGHFLSIDHVSLPLALGLGAAGRRMCGILFRPSVHYAGLGSARTRWREWVRDMRKVVIYRLMLLNQAVRVVLTLDPYFPPYAARHYRNGSKVAAVADPAHPPVNATVADSRLAESVPTDRTMFFLFGYLTERKGVLVLLDALQCLQPRIAGKIAVVFAGKIEPQIREEVAARCARVRTERPELWLHVEDRRISSGELDALVRRCDVVLAPYQRFVGSSGVLLWAARVGKPLITQDFGLLGRLVKDNQLGLAVDCSNPATLADGLACMATNGARKFISQSRAREFAAARTPQRFAATVFESLMHP